MGVHENLESLKVTVQEISVFFFKCDAKAAFKKILLDVIFYTNHKDVASAKKKYVHTLIEARGHF